MRTDGWFMFAATVVVALCLGACGGSRPVPGGVSTDDMPEDVRAAYDVFSVRCRKCHSLARPLSAQIKSEAHWEQYVARMRRMPGSGIDEADAATILIFLKWHARQIAARERGEEM